MPKDVTQDPNWFLAIHVYGDVPFGFLASTPKLVASKFSPVPRISEPKIEYRCKVEIADPELIAPIHIARKGCSHATFQSNLCAALFRGVKVDRVEKILGYSMAQLRAHIERQFTRGMTWNNAAAALPIADSKLLRGHKTRVKCWHIDHIVPKTLFERGDIASAFALTNLRPLWCADNMKKGQKSTHLL